MLFNDNWQFCKQDLTFEQVVQKNESWEQIYLPHSWNAGDMVPGSVEPYVGVAWYKKEFMLPEIERNQRVLLEFEAAAIFSSVWVDGNYVGGRDGGFLGFCLDITEALVEQKKHTVFVRVDNAPNPNCPPPVNIDWECYGGIYRPVSLHIKNSAYMAYKGVHITTPQVSEESAKIVVKTKCFETAATGGRYILRHTLLDKNKNVILQDDQDIRTGYFHNTTNTAELPQIAEPELWSVDHPVLYTLKTEIYKEGILFDKIENRIGFRYYHFDSEQGFFLNGNPLKLEGVNIHQDYPGLGPACPDRFQYEEMKLLKEMGCNYMRTSHYPRNERCLDACDELGIIVMEEQPFWHGSIRSEQGEQFEYNALRLLKDMVEHHGNHPSIIIWNLVNEVYLGPIFDRGEQHATPDDARREKYIIREDERVYIKRILGKMYDAVREADPYRPISMVVGGKWKDNEITNSILIGDVIGYNGGALHFKPKDSIVNEFTGKKYDFVAEYFHDRYPGKGHIMSEGVVNDKPYQRAEWKKELTSWKNHAMYWNYFYSKPWFTGGSLWCFTDYHANGVYRTMGTMDVYRMPLEIYYFYKSIWNKEPFVHIVGHWDWQEQGEHDRTVTVFTNCKEVELFINGWSAGKGMSTKDKWPNLEHAPYVWENIKYVSGCIEAKGITDNGDVIEDKRCTSGIPVTFSIDTNPCTIAADGSDIAYVIVTVVDEQGNRCYKSFIDIYITVEGCAKLAYSEKQGVRGGIHKFAVRSNGQTGESIITVGGQGLRISKATIIAE